MQLLQVAGRSGVQYIHFAALRLLGVDMEEEFVQVLVPQIGIFILEV